MKKILLPNLLSKPNYLVISCLLMHNLNFAMQNGSQERLLNETQPINYRSTLRSELNQSIDQKSQPELPTFTDSRYTTLKRNAFWSTVACSRDVGTAVLMFGASIFNMAQREPAPAIFFLTRIHDLVFLCS